MDKKTEKRFNISENKDKFITKINTICKKCGFHNIGKYEIEEDMQVICCGSCGAFILTPEDMSEEDKQSIQLCVQQAIEEMKD